jgi:hypothetical protein
MVKAGKFVPESLGTDTLWSIPLGRGYSLFGFWIVQPMTTCIQVV